MLYPRLETPRHKAAIRQLRQLLSPHGTIWLSGENADGTYADPGIKISSIHSAKGLQFPAVILLWADLLPSKFLDRSEDNERSQMYIALTRAEQLMVVLHSGPSSYIDALRRNIGLPASEAVLGQPWLPDLATSEEPIHPA